MKTPVTTVEYQIELERLAYARLVVKNDKRRPSGTEVAKEIEVMFTDAMHNVPGSMPELSKADAVSWLKSNGYAVPPKENRIIE